MKIVMERVESQRVCFGMVYWAKPYSSVRAIDGFVLWLSHALMLIGPAPFGDDALFDVPSKRRPIIHLGTLAIPKSPNLVGVTPPILLHLH